MPVGQAKAKGEGVAAPSLKKRTGKAPKPAASPPKGDTFDGVEVPALHAEMRPITKVYDYPNNPRTHPPAQLALLAELIQKYGFYSPIIVDEDSVILAGHGRKTAAMMIGMDEVPVVVKRGLSEIEKSAMRISDNQTGLLSGWDQELIRSEMQLLKAAGYEMPLLGFGEGQLVAFTTLPGPPGEFGAYGEDIETDYTCPKCGYNWSGKASRDEE